MLIIGIILSVFVIAFICWLLFTLATYALPVFVGLTAAIAAYHHGAGVMEAVLIAILVGFATLAAGQIAFALIRSPLHPRRHRACLRRACRGRGFLRYARRRSYWHGLARLVCGLGRVRCDGRRCSGVCTDDKVRPARTGRRREPRTLVDH